jgi:cytochrome c oxidase subunit 3
MKYSEYDNFAFHPYNIILMLSFIAISALFLAFSVALVYNRVQTDLPPIKLPTLFIFNTLILIGSSYSMMWAKKAYKADETDNYQKALWTTVVLSLIFLVLQFFGWRQLIDQNIFIASNNSVSYLYLLSGLHFAHVIAGLPFLGLFLRAARLRMKEPVSVLVYFSDPEKKLKLRLLTLYWHFLDLLWIYLVIFFYVNYLIQ